MLYYFLYPLREYFTVFNVFKYITFRAAFASITAFLIIVIFAPPIIKRLHALKIGENVREKECPNLYDKHKIKQGTPTMGGILILIGVFASTLLWAELNNPYLLLALFVTLYMGVLG
ncbi:MAG: phospho-N-acetylmuramoyl-pentapeptide-transferase, partial [Candidatus Omnitrophica bacterium CG12_big_fil_rev_8_21_14_0_65_42_8]